MRKLKYAVPLISVTVMLSIGITSRSFAQNAPFTEQTSFDMQHQLHSDEFTFIAVGDNQVPILISHSEQAITKGVAFIIGDADMAFGRKDSLTHISKDLPSLGWTTVVLPSLGLSLGPTISFPIEGSELTGSNGEDTQDTNAEPQQNVSEQDKEAVNAQATEENVAENVEKNSVNATDKPMATQDTQAESINSYSFQGAISEVELVMYTQELAAYLTSALKHMQPTMGHRIVISQGISAATITKLIADGSDATQTIDALVISNPYWPIRKLNNKIPMIVAQTGIPMLDLVSPWDNSWSQQTQKLRSIKARTELKEVYRQTEIVGQTFDQLQMAYIVRQIKGWTTYLGW